MPHAAQRSINNWFNSSTQRYETSLNRKIGTMLKIRIAVGLSQCSVIRHFI